MCIVGEILPRDAFPGNIDAIGFERGQQINQFLCRHLQTVSYFHGH